MAKTPKKTPVPKGKPKAKDVTFKALAQAEPCTLTIPEWSGYIGTQFGPVWVTLPSRQVLLPSCCSEGESEACCAACDGIPTGNWGILWRDAAGNWKCLIHPGGEKVLRGNDDEPYWANL